MERVAVIGLPLAEVMGFRPSVNNKTEESEQAETAFDNEMQSAVRTSERQNRGEASGTRQQTTTTVSAGAPKETDWLPPIPAAKTGSVLELENPIPKVQELLVELGINPAQLQFELLDDVVSNPLGSGHVNHLMRVRMPNGWKEDFAVEYILRNPKITAHEIVNLSRLPPAPEHLRYV